MMARGAMAAQSSGLDSESVEKRMHFQFGITFLRIWLTGFLGVVGLMKGAGKLWHPLVS